MWIVSGRALPLLAAAIAALIAPGPALAASALVNFGGGFAVGTIVVHTSERRLYLVLENGQALRYLVGVGRIGRQWAGASYIEGKYIQPNWAPPADVRRDSPGLPEVIPGGAPSNPMGAAAMTLAGGEYAIHGTNAPDSIGGFVSYGCIRMYNEDIVDLYQRVSVGTTVLVTE
jgi:lipoprotein-anchoring transpeptidase ErfK/SrfK